MPVHTVHNSQTTISLAISFCICLLLWTAPCVTGQDKPLPPSPATEPPDAASPPATDASTYQAQQRQMVQKLRRLSNSLITREMHDEFEQNEREYKKIISGGTRTQKGRDVLKIGLQYEIFVLTDPDFQGNARLLGVEFQKIKNRISRSGSSLLNSADKKKFRQLVCDEAIAAVELLLNNNLIARSLGCELLLEMQTVAPKGGSRLQMHDKVSKILVDLLRDPQQPDAVRLRAVNCMKKYLQQATPFPQIQMAFAEILAVELRKKFTEVAYQDTILATLENITTARQPVAPSKPLHLEVAIELMRDRTRDILIRCRCARVLGRGGYDGQMNFDVLAWAVAELALETGVRFNQGAADKADPMWQRSGWYLYTAFHHEDRKDNKGFLNRDAKSADVKAAYDKSVAIMAHLMFSKDNISAVNLSGLNKWLIANKPKLMKWDPFCNAIR